jgi:hypothetical protein
MTHTEWGGNGNSNNHFIGSVFSSLNQLEANKKGALVTGCVFFSAQNQLDLAVPLAPLQSSTHYAFCYLGLCLQESKKLHVVTDVTSLAVCSFTLRVNFAAPLLIVLSHTATLTYGISPAQKKNRFSS